MASIGLQQVAEAGTTRKLESELKDQSEHIRTIIKARGIAFPNVTGRTFAVFRVDRKHHLMSLVSKIGNKIFLLFKELLIIDLLNLEIKCCFIVRFLVVKT